MRKDFISIFQPTGFYVNFESKTYGVCINIEDIENQEEIKNKIYTDKRNIATINYLKQEWREHIYGRRNCNSKSKITQ